MLSLYIYIYLNIITLDKYIIFDCPGQVELYTHNTAIKNIINILEKRDYRVKIKGNLLLLLNIIAFHFI